MDLGTAGAGDGGNKAEAERWLDVSVRLLAARDLSGSKRFAERALEAYPLIDGADEVLAVADVLLASSPPSDWYALLLLDSCSASTSEIKRAYRRLALLLDPTRNTHPGASSALKLVSDAFTFLSDPEKRHRYDLSLKSKPPADAGQAAGEQEGFWTSCPHCCFLHQYTRNYKNRTILCPNQSCRCQFSAVEIASEPPIVPGADMYYCSWGFFPLGFASSSHSNSGSKPYQPLFQWQGILQPAQIRPQSNQNAVDDNTENPISEPKRTRGRKKVNNAPSKEFPGSGSSSGKNAQRKTDPAAVAAGGVGTGININEHGASAGSLGNWGEGMVNFGNFNLTVESADDVLGNLQNLPFLKYDMTHDRM